jgi:CMP/dCMP kinase
MTAPPNLGPFVIAIDGPAASGKGTLARRLAEYFGLYHLDTGALYRAVAWKILKSGKVIENLDQTLHHALEAAQTLTLGETDDPALRSDVVAQLASKVAAFSPVRAALLGFQRRFATLSPGAVLDGRDIGTVVCPEAVVKLFLTASIESRAQRRWEELQRRGNESKYEAILADMRERDSRDSGRSVAPLVAALDAFVMDTSTLSADEVFHRALSIIAVKTGQHNAADLDQRQASGF